MAAAPPAVRHLLSHLFRAASKPIVARAIVVHSSKFLPPLFFSTSSSTPKTPPLSVSSAEKNHTLILEKDERVGVTAVNSDPVPNSSTIAAIVTSLGGPPSAVGIVRLSGPSAVSIVSRVFRPAGSKKKKRKNFNWRPTSHVVEYGVVLDPSGNVVDEVKMMCKT